MNDTIQNPSPDTQAKNLLQAKQRFISNVLTEKPDKLYRLDDFDTIRQQLFDNVENAVKTRFPLYNDRFTLTLEDVKYDDPADYSLSEQKKALLEGKSLTRRLRGRWVLKDSATDKPVSSTGRMTLMHVPYMTGRGTFIRNGHEYSFTNIMRLEPGVYTKQKDDEMVAQFNIRKGSGSGFNMRFIPKTGLFQVSRGTTNCPAYTVLKDMGVSDEDMEKSWGKELFEKNKAAGVGDKARNAANKIYNL